MSIDLTQNNLSKYFSLPTEETSAVVAGENPYNFIRAKNDTDTLIVTIGDSWTWGDDLDNNTRPTSVYGSIIAQNLTADFLNLGEPGAGNWHISRKIDELATISNQLDYKKIIVISVFTETGRDFDSISDQNIDYRNWLLNNISKPTDYYDFLKFINQHIADKIKNQLANFDRRYAFYFTTNFVDPLGFDVLKKYFLDYTWLQIICSHRNIKYAPDQCYLVSPWIIEKLHKVFNFAPKLDRNVWLSWINELVSNANIRANLCQNDQKNFYKLMHPTKQHHKNFADAVLSKIQSTNFYELKLENDRLLCIPELVDFCLKNQYQDIILRVNNEGHCLRYAGVYDVLDMFKFQSVKIYTFNILEHHHRYLISSKNWNFWLKNFKTFDFSYDYTWNEKYLFGCVYGRPSAPRLGIATHLAKHYNSKSLIRAKFVFDKEDSRRLFDLKRLFSWDPEAVCNLNILNSQTYYGDQVYNKGKYNQANDLSHLYKNFLIDLVSEPVCEGHSFYPTEKIVRAMLCKRPFIVMASKNYLDYLRQLGFHSFSEFWNEDYDGYDGKNRYHKILSLIDNLSNKSQKELLDLYYSMTYQLDHNYNLIVKQSYKSRVTPIKS